MASPLKAEGAYQSDNEQLKSLKEMPSYKVGPEEAALTPGALN